MSFHMQQMATWVIPPYPVGAKPYERQRLDARRARKLTGAEGIPPSVRYKLNQQRDMVIR